MALAPGKAIAEVPASVVALQLDLDLAWQRVQAKAGMAGCDGLTTARFGRAAAACLRALSRQLCEGSYQPWPLRVAELPKKDGTTRLLLIPSVTDRIAQSAVASWIGQRWNPCFHPSSFAYRPGMGVRDAYRALAAHREAGLHWVLDADIERFLDRVPYCPRVHESCSNSCGCWSTTLIRKPLRRPCRTSTAASSPRFTRCNTVCLETPSLIVASSMGM